MGRWCVTNAVQLDPDAKSFNRANCWATLGRDGSCATPSPPLRSTHPGQRGGAGQGVAKLQRHKEYDAMRLRGMEMALRNATRSRSGTTRDRRPTSQSARQAEAFASLQQKNEGLRQQLRDFDDVEFDLFSGSKRKGD